MFKILISGATGFIGSNLLNYFAKNGNYKVFYTGTDNENKVDGIKVGGNFQNIEFNNDLQDLDVLFHQAAITDTLVKDRSKVMGNNGYSSIDLFKKAINAKCKKIVYASSCAVYGNSEPPFRESGPVKPLNVYAESKLLLDRLIFNNLDLSYTKIIGLRYSNVYGIGESHKSHYKSMISKIINSFIHNEEIVLFKWGEQKRDFIYIKDIVDLNVRAASYNENCIFNGGSGIASSFNEIYNIIKENYNTKPTVRYIDNPYEAVYQNLTMCDMSLAKEKLEFTPKWSLKEGILDLISQIK